MASLPGAETFYLDPDFRFWNRSRLCKSCLVAVVFVRVTYVLRHQVGPQMFLMLRVVLLKMLLTLSPQQITIPLSQVT